MKVSPVVLLTILSFARITLAAPSISNPTIDDNFYDLIDGNFDEIDDFVKYIRCIRSVTKKVIGESSFKKDFEKFSNIIERLLKELDFCREGENARQCTGDVELNITLAFSEFLATVYQANKELAEKIVKAIRKCPRSGFFGDEEVFLPSPPEQFQCIVDVLGLTSKANGLGDLWAKDGPELQKHVGAWRKCDKAGNNIQIVLCNIKESFLTVKLFIQYMINTKINKTFVEEFVHEVKQKCAGQAF